MRQPAAAKVELDRACAIQWAVQQALQNDIVLVAGKGHEDYQIVGDQRLPFSDIDVSANALNNKKRVMESQS